VNSQGKGKENPLRDRGGNYLSTISLDNSNMFLREKYNSELSRRREYFKKTSGRYSDRETGLAPLSKYQEEGNEDDEASIECPFARYEPPANAPIDSLTIKPIELLECFQRNSNEDGERCDFAMV
jgi:hypothetical protein